MHVKGTRGRKKSVRRLCHEDDGFFFHAMDAVRLAEKKNPSVAARELVSDHEPLAESRSDDEIVNLLRNKNKLDSRARRRNRKLLNH